MYKGWAFLAFAPQPQWSIVLHCSPTPLGLLSLSPPSPYTSTIVPQLQGYRANILYTVPLTPFSSLRAPVPALPLSISVPCISMPSVAFYPED
jgi:hypothetical protein